MIKVPAATRMMSTAVRLPFMSRVPGCDAPIGRHRHDLVFSSYGSRYPAALWLAIGLLVTPLPVASGQQAEPPPAGEQRWVDRLSQRAVDGDLETIRAEHEETQASLVTIEKEIEAAEKKLTADWDKKLQEETSKYEVLIAEIDAGARVYEARVKADAEAEAVALEAQGQLDVDKARALRDVLRNDILNSRGGDIYLALIAAEKMRISSITLNSNDPRVPIILDLDAMAELLVGSPSDADE